MTCVIIGWDGPEGQSKRLHHRPAHVEHLERLQKQGQLVCAGPFTDKAGSLVIIETDTMEKAESIANADPYLIHGVFERVEVHPFDQVFPMPGKTKNPPSEGNEPSRRSERPASSMNPEG